MAAMTVVNFANVFVRYVLKSNLHWALEFTVIAFAWIIFLGAAWGIKAGAHIGVDTILKVLYNLLFFLWQYHTLLLFFYRQVL